MSLKNLQTRINYYGGSSQHDRMIEDKVKSLKKALLYSYQSATIALPDNREFKSLINSNKLSMEADDKILSIPFKGKCLNNANSNEENINLKIGDVITWKRAGGEDSYWIIYSQYLQETAYFRGQMRQCENAPIEINNKRFYYYLKGSDEKSIDWQKTKHLIFNNLNHTAEIYISNTTETKQFFQRFAKIKIHERSFEVQAVDDLSIMGILLVYLKEDYANPWEPVVEPETPPVFPDGYVYIDGPSEIYPYQTATYTVLNTSAGQWILSNNRARIIESTFSSVKIEVLTGRSGDIDLIYRTGQSHNNDVVKNIKILSL